MGVMKFTLMFEIKVKINLPSSSFVEDIDSFRMKLRTRILMN